MSQLFNTNNPGIGDTGGVTLEEGILLSQLASLSYSPGDLLYIDGTGSFVNLGIGAEDEVLTAISGLPSWEVPSGGGAGAVDSVNGQTGVVVLDADDISDASTVNKFATQAELDKLAGIEAGADVNNISDVNATGLTGGGDTTLHTHDGRYYTESEVDTFLSGKENLTNKATNFSTVNDTLYPTVEAVTEYVASAVVGLLDYRGTYDASTNLYPATGGSGLVGAILKGDFYIVSVAGILGGTPVTAGDLVIALVDTPAQTSSNWDIVSGELGYTAENIANKVTSISGASTDVQYPSAKLLYDQLALKAAALGADDNYVTDAEKAALHAAVTVTDSMEIDLEITGQDITAVLKDGSISRPRVDASLESTLALADTSSQPWHTHTASDITDFNTVADSRIADAIGVTIPSLAGDTFTGDISVPDEAYDATAWDGSLEVPTKNAIRDKIESMSAGSGISEELAIAYAVAL